MKIIDRRKMEELGTQKSNKMISEKLVEMGVDTWKGWKECLPTRGHGHQGDERSCQRPARDAHDCTKRH